jgi:PPOX class probable F420-dependent enzyme
MVAMAMISQAVRDLLATGPFAHLITTRSNGQPHVQLSWAGLDGDELVFATFFDPKRVARVRRNPWVTASFQAKAYEGPGLYPYVVISGTARVTEGGALEVMDRLSEVYIGPGAKYPYRDGPPGWVFRMEIEQIYGQGPWNPRWLEMTEGG